MPRPRYTNYPPTDLRWSQFERLARVLGLDPEQHLDRVKMLDFGMLCAQAAVTLLQQSPPIVKVQSNDPADPA